MKKKGVNGRAKGSRNELVLAKAFQTWWGHGQFARTPMSGGWASPGHRDGFRTHGDIITTALDFPFTIEAKKQEAWSLDALLHNDGCLVHEWYEQADTGTPKDMMPLLVAARNLVPQVVIFDRARMARMLTSLRGRDAEVDALMSTMPCDFWEHERHYIVSQGVVGSVAGLVDWVVMPLKNFFKTDPNLFGRKMPVTKDDQASPDRAKIPEPVIPRCTKCGKPLTQCACTDNNLKK